MKSFYVSESDLCALLKAWAGGYRLVAPKREGPSVLFRPYAQDELPENAAAALTERATLSAKEVMFPKSEVLLAYTASKNEENRADLDQRIEDMSVAAVKPVVLFGLRPCDARGFAVLDKPYLEGRFVDPYYKARREAAVIVTCLCTDALPTCFCTWVGGSPNSSEGSDVTFVPVQDGFLFTALTEKGLALFDGASLREADADHDAQAQAALKSAEASMPASPFPAGLSESVAAAFTLDAFWEKETVKCLSCNACTYVCPTCQCFNITDEGSPLDGRRVRSWDSCMSPLFTLEASGYNPRAKKYQRMRNRIEHKFNYYPGDHEGMFSCVGCGRCVRSCPVSLDIRSVVLKAAEQGAAQKG
ncbi:MAG: 4Fe-4S dicluster domain-containing protein [Mailhella sp.]|nr:4Fe-4S dicluster domain-containing protein [Mailhella sp.]